MVELKLTPEEGNVDFCTRVRARFTAEFGLLNRRRAVFELCRAAQAYGVSVVEVIDDGGWLSTQYQFTVEGWKDSVMKYLKAVEEWAS